MERTVLAQDVKEILEQSRKILEINSKLIEFLMKNPPIITHAEIDWKESIDELKTNLNQPTEL